ncbi:MAG: type II secretion system protein GspF [Gammaproteobacteria bacterium]|nr:MAG: type II secretion system protein GspF [Gammaproteobacteria bacterium]
MPAYEYTALNNKGRKKKDVISADSSRHARQLLRDKGFTPLTVSQVQDRNRSAKKSVGFSRGISQSELSIFTRQFATLISSGLTIEQSLDALLSQAEGHRMKTMLGGVRAAVLEGSTLADAMRRYPSHFPEIYPATVAVGEETGRLALVLERLADYNESRQALSQKIVVALIYPVVLLFVAVGIVVALMTFVIPKITSVYINAGNDLPPLTVAMISISDFIRHYGLWVLAVLGTLQVAFLLAMRKPALKMSWHRFKLKLPWIGRLIRGLNSARMARTLAIMTQSGVPLISGLKASSRVVGNMEIRNKIQTATEEVGKGASLNRALARTGYFPPVLLQMVASGEASGDLDTMLEKAASIQEQELTTKIQMFVGLFEPLMILFMGAIVLVIVMAVLMPIFDLGDMLK